MASLLRKKSPLPTMLMMPSEENDSVPGYAELNPGLSETPPVLLVFRMSMKTSESHEGPAVSMVRSHPTPTMWVLGPMA